MTHKLYHEKTCIVKYNVRYILSLFSFLLYKSNRKKNRKKWEEDESRMGKEKRKKKIWKFKYKKLTWFLVNIFKIKVYYLHLKKEIVLALALWARNTLVGATRSCSLLRHWNKLLWFPLYSYGRSLL